MSIDEAESKKTCGECHFFEPRIGDNKQDIAQNGGVCRARCGLVYGSRIPESACSCPENFKRRTD